MRRTPPALLLAALILARPSAPPAAQDINLCIEQESLSGDRVENGSFETCQDDFAVAWTRTANTCRIVDGAAPDGQRWLVMSIPGDGAAVNVVAKQPVPVTGGGFLRLAFMARATTTRAADTRVIVSFRNAAGEVIDHAIQTVEDSDAWTPYVKIITVPPDAQTAWIELALIRVPGEMALDSLQLAPIRYPRAWSELDYTKGPASAAIDGVDAVVAPHYWTGGKVPNTFYVELLGERLVERVVWRYFSAAPVGRRTEYGAEDYSIWASKDGEVWFLLVDQKGFLGGWNEHAFPPVRARYVRMRIDRTQMMYYPILAEFEVWGSAPPAATSTVADVRAAPPEAGAATLAAPRVTVQVSRLRSEPGTPLTATVEITGLSSALGSAACTLWLQQGMNPPRRIGDWSIPEVFGERANIDVTLDPDLGVGGYHLLAEWRGPEGTSASGDDVFMISDDPRAGRRTYSFYGPIGLQPAFPEAEVRKHVQRCREFYADTLKLSQRWVEMGVVCPRTSPYVTSPFNFLNSQRTARLWCELLHEAGLGCIAYHLFGYAGPVDKPEWWVYGPLAFPTAIRDTLAYGEMLIGKDLAKTFPAGKPAGVRQSIWPNNGVFQNTLAMQDYYIDECFRDMLQAGWDGYFLDEVYAAFEPTAYGHDPQGRRITDLSADDVGDTVLSAVRDGVQSQLGRVPLLVGNFGNLSGMAPGYRESVAAVLANRGRTTYAKTARHLVWFLELLGAPEAVTSQRDRLPQTYEHLGRALHGIRELNNTPVIVELCEYTRKKAMQTVDNVAPAYAVLCAAGATHEVLFSDARVRETVVKPYNKFCTRYADYLFPFTIQWATNVQVAVAPAAKLYWRDTVFRKPVGPGAAELYIHLINLPDEHGLYEITHTAPPSATQVEVTLALPAGTVAREAACMGPDGDQNPIALPLNGSRLTVPLVRTWTLVVVRVQEGPQP